MNLFEPATVRCACGHEYPVEVATGLHVSTRPELRSAILDGTLHRFSCPSCGTATIVEPALPYTDFPRQHWFTVAPRAGVRERGPWRALAQDSFRATMVDGAPPVVKAWSPVVLRRLIFGLAALREKLLVLDAGLDDRAVEALKLRLLEDMRLPDSAREYCHVIAIPGPGDDGLLMEYAHPDGGTVELPVPHVMYRQLLWDMDAPGYTGPRIDDVVEDMIVDYRVALFAGLGMRATIDGEARAGE